MTSVSTEPQQLCHKYACRKLKGRQFEKPTEVFDCQTELSLYVLCHSREVLYVGESLDCIDKLTDKKKEHSWRYRYVGQALDCHLFSFHEPPNDFMEMVRREDDEGRSLNLKEIIRRTIEAEVTYAVRQRHGRWPTRQHEIHFYARLSNHPFVSKAVSFVINHLAACGLLEPAA